MGHTPKKERGFTVNFTPEEEKEFSKVAKDAGLSLEQLIRSLLRAYEEDKRIRQ